MNKIMACYTEGLSKKNCCFIVQLISIFCSLSYLCITESLYADYLLCGFCGILALIKNSYFRTSTSNEKKRRLYFLLSAFIALCVTFANYDLLSVESVLKSYPLASDASKLKYYLLLKLYASYRLLWIAIGSFFTSNNIMLVLDDFCNCAKKAPKRTKQKFPVKMAGICFLIFVCINLLILFLCNYPGNLSPDSISQMTQILYGNYSNHHPFWHTMLIKGCVTIGMIIFQNINSAVACYSVFQILFMGVCFSYCIVTLYQMGVPRTWLIISILFYAITPYNISYSMTMWKDVPFGGAVLLLTTSLLRIFQNIGQKKWLSWCMLVIGGLGMCLWRSNGWIAFAITLFIFIILFRRQYHSLLIVLSSLLIVTYVLIHPVLSVLGVKQPDAIEALSIPAQQIARVVTTDKVLSGSDKILLSNIVDIGKIPKTYDSHISDPIKNLVRESDYESFLLSHKVDFFKLWISLGVKYPVQYFTAWIDQTKGYWNGGYRYWICGEGIVENEIGVNVNIKSTFISILKKAYFTLFENDTAVFALFRSIGLCTWLFAGCATVCWANKRRKQAFLTVPVLAVIATLCIATPVFCEFRYAYSAFTCLPLIICVTFYNYEEGDMTCG